VGAGHVEAAARQRCVEVAEPACRGDDGGVSVQAGVWPV
jgi:hypothetical protein